MPQEKWKERLDRLPVQLAKITRGGVSPDECIEGELEDSKYIGSRDWLLTLGVKYHFAFSGSDQGRERLIEQISAELGRPESFNRRKASRWHYFWPSESTEIPETNVHQILGRTRIQEICQSFRLNEKDERIIDELLAIDAMYIGFDKPRADYTLNLLSDLDPDRQERITEALLQINVEFARRALDYS